MSRLVVRTPLRAQPRAGGILRHLAWATLLGTALLAAPTGAVWAERSDAIEAADRLVRGRYYEGLPVARGREVPEQAIPHLVSMLQDPDELPHHANVVFVLGLSPHPDALAALLRAAASPPRGRVGAAQFNARLALRRALGHQAASDDRALDWLVAASGDELHEPGWFYFGYRGERLARLLRRAALQALALSGRREAGARLHAVLARDLSGGALERDPELQRHAAAWLALHERMATQRREAAFAPQPATSRR